MMPTEPEKGHDVMKGHDERAAGKETFFSSKNFKPMELIFEELLVQCPEEKTVKDPATNSTKKVKGTKTILNKLHGSLRAGKFTAIMGPSGSGKTTLLNFLSGRIESTNLNITGSLKLNGKYINDIEKFNHMIAYVMQDDILLATFTPRESLMFAANLRLNANHDEKVQKVEALLRELHLEKCADTRVGNVMIRGVSGGERKRTSIGVELITNPSMVFLDEPTTGLDSETALRVIEILKNLASYGRTVISTIHQPSSEIFNEFDQLMLLVRGNIIYQGEAKTAVQYFGSINFQCPTYSNPADYFMRIMNEDDILLEAEMNNQPEPSHDEVESKFNSRVEYLTQKYQEHFKDTAQTQETTQLKEDEGFQVGLLTQFGLLFARSLLNEMRNPMEVRMKTFQAIFMALLTWAVFNNLGNDFSGVQNRNGVLFFTVTGFCFGSIQGALGTFSQERALFLRERTNKQYTVGAYFWGKSLSEMPFQIIWPWIMISIIYFGVGLNQSSQDKYWIAVLVAIITYYTGTAYGLLISVCIPKLEVAMAMTPVVLIPLMAFAGFFVNQDKIPYYFIEFEYISPWKYAFQALCWNEFTDNTELRCLTQAPRCDPLGDLNFHEGMWLSIIIQAVLGTGFRILSYGLMWKISTPPRPKIKVPEHHEQQGALGHGQMTPHGPPQVGFPQQPQHVVYPPHQQIPMTGDVPPQNALVYPVYPQVGQAQPQQ